MAYKSTILTVLIVISLVGCAHRHKNAPLQHPENKLRPVGELMEQGKFDEAKALAKQNADF